MTGENHALNLGHHLDAAGDPAGFFRLLVEALGADDRVALCTLVYVAGSVPRGAGAKLLVGPEGRSVGSVGGGALEAQVIGWASEALRAGHATCRSLSLDAAEAAGAGMVCGGEVEVLVEPLDGADPAQREFFTAVLAHLVERRRGWLATAMLETAGEIRTGRLLIAGGRSVACVPLAGESPPEDFPASSFPPAPSLVQRGAVRYFVEPLVPADTVHVFGAGHIAERLVPLCHWLGFRTVVLDDRADFASPERFPEVDELIVPASLEAALEGRPLDLESYVVIITRGHASDQAILRQALQRRPAYIGMIGSRRKRGVVFAELARDGFTPEDLARVACPIGLPIGAETPEEIAVSIAAQLVAARAARRGGG